MIQLSHVVPTNYLEEKAKFFADHTYNPQFTYKSDIDELKLSSYGLPKPNLTALASKIVGKSSMSGQYGLHDQELSTAEVDSKIREYLHNHKIADHYRIKRSANYIVRISICKGEIRLRKDARFFLGEFQSVLNHEIGTHVLRRINDERQPWFNKRTLYHMSNALPTEEGLASINALIAAESYVARSVAIRYLATQYALTHSLAEIWQFLTPYILDEETRWLVSFRQKRGMKDTSAMGAFTKDIVYFEGLYEVWRWLRLNDWNAAKLYIGRVSTADANRLYPLCTQSDLLLPDCMTSSEEYAQKVEQIGIDNNFDSIK